MSSSTVALGKYVYAFVRAADAHDIIERGLTGLNDCNLKVSIVGSLGAVTTDIAVEKIRPRRQLLAAHQSVVTEISGSWDMLPVSFGLIAESEAEICRILAANTDVLETQLDRVGGQVEMNLVLRLSSENVFQYFVDRFPELQEARSVITAGATRDEMIEMGRLFERLLASERNHCERKMVESIQSVCKETDLQPPRSEGELVRLNCLIDRENEAEFSAAIHRAAEAFNEDYVFNLSGPWPPYSFVTLALTRDE
jgi:hypothetical protein